MLNTTSPPWRATTRRAENDRPSRSRSTRKTVGRAASPLRKKYPCSECGSRSSGTVRAGREERLRGDLTPVQRQGIVEDHAAPEEVAVDLLQVQHVQNGADGARCVVLGTGLPAGRSVAHAGVNRGRRAASGPARVPRPE